MGYRLSGMDWEFTNVTAGGTHQFISESTPGVNETEPFDPNVFEMRVSNWGYGVQVDKVHVSEGESIEKLAPRPRSIEFIGDSLTSGMYASYESLFSFAYGVGEGFGNTEYSITARPGICVTDQECFGNPRDNRISGSIPHQGIGGRRRFGATSRPLGTLTRILLPTSSS